MNQNTRPNVGRVANSGSGTPVAGAPSRHVEAGIKRVRAGDGNPTLIKIDDPLDDTNWFSWRPYITLVLKLCGVHAYVKGEITRPDPVEDPAGADNWTFNDTYAQVLISINLSPSEMVYVGRCTTAHDMWAKLEEVHKFDASMSQCMNGLFYTRYEDGEDLCKHLNKMLQFREKLNLMKNEDSLSDLPFKQIIAASLPRSWDWFTSPYVEGEQKDLVTALQFIGILRERYFLNEMRNLRASSHRTEVHGMSCNQRKRSNTDRSHSEDSHHRGKNRCGVCGKFGHVQDECWFAKNKKRKRDRNLDDGGGKPTKIPHL
jgi:hypothetical protein